MLHQHTRPFITPSLHLCKKLCFVIEYGATAWCVVSRGVVKYMVIGSKVMSSNLDFKFSLIVHNIKRTKM